MAPDRVNVSSINHLRNSSNSMHPSTIPSHNLPPPLPPRPHLQTNYLSYPEHRGFSSNYYGNYSYGTNYYRNPNYFSNYSPSYYGSTNYTNGDIENRLMHYSEGNIRSTFQSLETVLQTFSSLTMMMESTYFAITNSFRALITVAASVDRLRSTLGQILSTFAIIRLLKWIHKKILYIFGIKTEQVDSENLWHQLTTPETLPETNNSWSGMMVFGAIIVIPYLINRILKNLKNLSTPVIDNPKEWFNQEDPVHTVTALYDFASTTNEELSIKAGQKLWLAPSSIQPKNCPGWWRATDSVNVGLIPANYVTIVGQLRKKSNNSEQHKGETCDSTTTL